MSSNRFFGRTPITSPAFGTQDSLPGLKVEDRHVGVDEIVALAE